VLFLFLLAAPASAVVHTVTQVGLTFDPEDLTVNVGDTVEWVWATGIHTVTSGTDLTDPNLGGVFDQPLDSSQPSVSFTFNETGEVPYLCRFHFGLGMTGVIRVATGVTHTINQVGVTFVPDDLSINLGDTVEWIWSSGLHTVTNGTDFSDPNFGALFDAPFDEANPSFSFTFFTSGEVPYFCQPHLTLGMTGIVRIQDPTPVLDLPGQSGLTLYQNTPNPFNPMTLIRYTMLEPGPVSLGIYDLSGRLIRNLLNGEVVGSGLQEAEWQGRDETGRQVAAGVYLYRLESGAMSLTKRMTLVK